MACTRGKESNYLYPTETGGRWLTYGVRQGNAMLTGAGSLAGHVGVVGLVKTLP